MDFSNLTLVAQPRVDPKWLMKDYLGALRVRFSLGRNMYRVTPGLYKLGNPGKDAEVMVTSNYKLSFDIVRRSLKGVDAWILVLETFGINVWCAAGKGTFGTVELIKQIKNSQLHQYVSHKRVIVPQLGAPGVSGYRVTEATGFSVKFGPVRAEDIKEFLSAERKKTKQMSSVRFRLKDRLILTPVEIVNSLRYLLIAIVAIVLISGIGQGGYSFSAIKEQGLLSIFYILLAYGTGTLVAPVLLPYLPFRHFGGKGFIAGFLTFGLVTILNDVDHSMFYVVGWLFISGAISSFLTMNFTGASTYTSLSGVRKEMRLFVPLQIAFILFGLALVIISKMV